MSDKEMVIRDEKKIAIKDIDIGNLITGVGQIEITDEQQEILFAPVDENKIETRPDGLIYLPWVFYTERLNKAFPMQWAIIPKGEARYLADEKLMMREYLLIIKGSLMASAVGEQNYYENNEKMSYTDAIEGTKSNALMRCCKAIGISNELWQPEFITKWKKEHTDKIWDDNKGKYLWYKIGDDRLKKKKKDTKNDEPIKDDNPAEGARKATDFKRPLKSKAYLQIEEEIVSYISAPYFTGELMFGDKKYNLDEVKNDRMSHLNNTVYHMNDLKKMRNIVKRMAETAEIRQPEDVDRELSDDELFDINTPAEHEGNLSK